MSIRGRFEYVLKHNSWIMKTFIFLGSSFFRFIGLFVKIDDSLVLLNSYSGKFYNDSPKKIYELMINDPRCKDYKYVWAFREPDKITVPGNCKKIKIDTWKYFVTALKAKVWIANVNIERGLKFKKKEQYYLNTWHGTSVNFVGNAVDGRDDFKWDYVNAFCFAGEYEREFIKRDFCVTDEHLLPSGLPRNDDLYTVDETRIRSIKTKLGFPLDKKVVLYAPTWRESTDGGENCNIKPPINVAKWRDALADKYILIFRTHHYTKAMLGIEFDEFVRDGSDYPDVNDLLVIADYLISDYSCIMMDYCILGRPIIEFGYDYDEYSKTRGFYLDLDKDIPSHILRTEEEVLKYISDSDYLEECKKAQKFRDEHIDYGGHAAQMCVDAILSGIKVRNK